jgi:uncharacterized protein with von Willebrand factor type A (vWA) domain
MLGLLANAVITVALHAAWLLLIVHAVQRARSRVDRVTAIFGSPDVSVGNSPG